LSGVRERDMPYLAISADGQALPVLGDIVTVIDNTTDKLTD